jgi:integrase
VAAGIARTTVNARIAALRASSRAMAQQGLGEDFAASVTDRLRIPVDTTTQAERALTPRELAELLATCPPDGSPLDRRDRALIVLGAWEGLREGEMARLSWSQLEDGCLRRVVGKGGRVDDIELLPPTLEALIAWRSVAKTTPGGPMFHAVPPPIEGPIRPISRSTIYSSLRRRAKAAGISDFCVHDLRHTCAMGLLRGGVPPHLVQMRMRHSSFDVTFKNYFRAGDVEHGYDYHAALRRAYQKEDR